VALLLNVYPCPAVHSSWLNGLGGAPVVPSSGPLPDALLEELEKLPEDELQTKRRQDAHYIKGNEYDLALFSDSIRNLGGAYLGIGSDQGFTLAATARAELLFLFDYDEVVVREMAVYVSFLRRAESEDDLIALWGDPAAAQRTAQILEEDFGKGTDCKLYVSLLRRYGKQIREHLESSRKMAREGARSHWLGDPESFAYICTMARQGRIIVKRGDLLKGVTVSAIGRFLKRHAMPMRVFYLSNAEEYWSRYSDEFETSVANLPMDARSVVLRTFHDTKLPKKSPQNEYHYNVQKGLDLARRVSADGRLRYRAMMKHVQLQGDGWFSLLGFGSQ